MSRNPGAVTPLFSQAHAARPAFRATASEVQRRTPGGWSTVAVCDDAGWASYVALALCFAADPSSPLADHDLARAE